LQAVIDIGSTEFSLVLSHVAMSRAKSLNGLLLYPFGFDRIEKLKINKGTELRSSKRGWKIYQQNMIEKYRRNLYDLLCTLLWSDIYLSLRAIMLK